MTDRPDGEEIAELFRRFADQRRRRDRNALVEAHLGLAHHIAERYARRGVARDDLHQVALLGLVKAVDRFDPDRAVAFTTFAGATIEGELKRHFRDATWDLHVPRSAKERHVAIRRAEDELRHELGRSPKVPEVARRVGCTDEEVVEAVAVSAAHDREQLDPRVHAPVATPVDGSGLRVEPSEAVVDRVVVEQLLDSLPEREREIVRLRFYEDKTQTEIAEAVGLSQMHVSRLLRRSFEELRRHARAPA